MYKLDSAPIFLEFLDMFLKKIGSKVKIKRTNRLFLYDKCVCGKDYCNTFFLKSKRKIEEELYLSHSIETNKGTFSIELLDDGIFVFSATNNKNFPFKEEFEKMFKNYKATVKNKLLAYPSKQKLFTKDKQKLHNYFMDFELLDKVYMIDETIDSCIKRYI